MKITKQTAYRHTVAQRAMRMEEIVAWVKDERTRDKLALFREKLRRAYPDKRYPFTRKLPQLLFAGTFRKGELKEYNGWILLEINRLNIRAAAGAGPPPPAPPAGAAGVRLDTRKF